jgi:membrane dipeptidase
MPVGMEDCTYLPKITEALMRKCYSASDLRKIFGQNTLRLLDDVERVSVPLRKTR